MTRGERVALFVGGGLAAVAGIGTALVAAGIVPNPFAPPQPANWPSSVGPWPRTAAQAHQDLIALDTAWWEDWLSAGKPSSQAQWTQAMQQLHLAAELIRQAYPGSGPSGGYTCHALVSMGTLPSNFPCPTEA